MANSSSRLETGSKLSTLSLPGKLVEYFYENNDHDDVWNQSGDRKTTTTTSRVKSLGFKVWERHPHTTLWGPIKPYKAHKLTPKTSRKHPQNGKTQLSWKTKWTNLSSHEFSWEPRWYEKQAIGPKNISWEFQQILSSNSSTRSPNDMPKYK